MFQTSLSLRGAVTERVTRPAAVTTLTLTPPSLPPQGEGTPIVIFCAVIIAILTVLFTNVFLIVLIITTIEIVMFL
jgi:hypothetical protein